MTSTVHTNHDPLAGLPPEVQAQLREGYLDEAVTLADDLEAALLSLERQPNDPPTVDAAFRAAHTIKGSAAGVGCTSIAAFTHGLEDALEGLRTRTRELTPDGLAALLAGVDLIRALIVSERTGAQAPPTEAISERITMAFASAGTPAATAATAAVAAQRPSSEGDAALAAAFSGLGAAGLRSLQDQLDGQTTLYRIQIVLPESAFMLGLDPLALLGSLAEEATLVQVTPLVDRVPAIDALDPFTCYLGFSLIVVTTGSADDLHAVFEFSPEGSIIEMHPVGLRELAGLAASHRDGNGEAEVRAGWKHLGEMLVEEGLIRPEDLDRVLEKQSALGSPPDETSSATGDDGRTLRVKQARLDDFLDLVGELVTARNALLHLQQVVENDYDVPELARRFKQASGTLNRTVSQLQTEVLALRMVPVRTVFQRLTRVGRDVAARQGKHVDLRYVGEDTELDKTVADALVDPLVHLVRNAVDHGIEDPTSRQAAGKSERGAVTLTAARDGNAVVIDIRDDGVGLNPDRLRAAAVAKGIMGQAEADQLTDAEAFQLVFAAGFSTAAQLSDISGRGVGMDVVRSSVARMGGHVGIRSEAGQGTTFRLELPLTLSVFRALMVRAGDAAFAIPLDAVRETAAVAPEACASLFGREIATIGGDLIGLVPLVDILGVRRLHDGMAVDDERAIADAADADGTLAVVVVEGGGERIGLIVDALDQPQEIMVKPLEPYLSAGGAIAGASVMGDGRVALVLEPAGIVRLAMERSREDAASEAAERASAARR